MPEIDPAMKADSDFDVIVVGAGGSGLAAAVSAAERSGRVLVLEKRPQPGGTTGIAVGSFTASGTRLQQAAGISDRAENHEEDAGRFADPAIEARNDSELRRYFLTEAAETLAWLEGFGLTFVGPQPEPPNRVPRMHNVVPGAKAYIAALQLQLLKRGGVLLCHADVRELLQEEGRITGVRAEVDGSEQTFHARRGVILAAGDYANSAELIARHKGEGFAEVEGINPFATGDGHRLAEQAGAKLLNMDVTYGPELRFVPSSRRPLQQWLPVSGLAARLMGAVAGRLPAFVMRAFIKRLLVTWQHPEDALFEDGAVLINARGEPFVDATIWPDRELAVARQPGKLAYILLDAKLVERYSAWPHFISTAPDIAYAYALDYLRLRPDVARMVRSRDELADYLSHRTRQEVSGAGDAPDRIGDRLQATLSADIAPPWLVLGPVKAYFTTTEGGAAIDPHCRVLDATGTPIPGLYAVGQNGLGGMILWGHGLHIAWAMTSGRLAGRDVMG